MFKECGVKTMKNKRPILFSTPMVQALLDGSKTQTRRIIQVGKHPAVAGYNLGNDGLWYAYAHSPEIRQMYVTTFPYAGTKCPYGKVGDLLWVRETFYHDERCNPSYSYKADNLEQDIIRENQFLCNKLPWKPSIHLPRWASRITLEILNIRVERLQDLSSGDAIAEGIKANGEFGYKDYSGKGSNYCNAPRPSYFSLWEKINGEGSVKNNPWVWVIEFKLHRANVDSL